jgi:hypothetical protein
MPSQRTLDLVTVVYEPELYVLETQARSMALRFRPEHINEILVLVNDRPLDIPKTWWGSLSDKVRVLTRADVGYAAGLSIHGWESQQIMKLLGVANSTADWCMVLDAKTWFVRAYDPADLFIDERVRFGVFNSMPAIFEPGMRYVESLFGAKPGKYLAPGGVPNMMKPEVVRSMMREISELTQMPFERWFEDNCRFDGNGVTEFACHSAYVCYRHGWQKFYAGQQVLLANNLADWQIDQFDSWYAALDRCFTASIQEKAKPLLSDTQFARWQIFLKDRGL